MQDHSFFYLLTILSPIFSLVPLTVGLIRIKSIKGYLVPVFILVVISFLVEGINYVLKEFSQNNLYIFHAFTIIEFSLISICYYLFFKSFFKSNFILYIIGLFFIVAFIDYKINGFNSIDNFSISVESLVLSGYSLIWFLFVMRKLLFEDLFAVSFFWLNAGVLIYFSGNLLLFAFSNYLHETESLSYYLMWSTIHSILNILYNILISLGFWKAKVS